MEARGNKLAIAMLWWKIFLLAKLELNTCDNLGIKYMWQSTEVKIKWKQLKIILTWDNSE